MNSDSYEKKLELQLFINTGNGFSEKDSVRIFYEKDRQKYEFDITGFKHIKIFRFDPLNESCVVSIENAYAEDKNGNVYKLRFLFTNAAIHKSQSSTPLTLSLKPPTVSKTSFRITEQYIN